MEQGNELIFVSIASYRDAQLVPTVEDLLRKADAPGLLRFGICWQHDAGEAPLPFAGDGRFGIVDVDWSLSRGACWARAEAMTLWQGEQWFLQIDSHCRFARGWDTKLIRMMGDCASERPILSTYANAFTPSESGSGEVSGSRELLEGPPLQMAIEGFTEEGIPRLKPVALPVVSDRERPVRARFLSGGFLFAPGAFVRDVPYDPEVYFLGEEISMTLRAFTSGYDLFHPTEAVVWHDYVRAYAVRHWDDHGVAAERGQAGPAWMGFESKSRAKVRELLTGDGSQAEAAPLQAATGLFALGAVRTRRDYEEYAGISFALRKQQDYTRLGLAPPNPPASPDWPERIFTWMVRVTPDAASLATVAAGDDVFWAVCVLDAEGREIHRRDVRQAELETMSGPESHAVLLLELESGIVPFSWTVQPFRQRSGWGARTGGEFEEADLSIVF